MIRRVGSWLRWVRSRPSCDRDRPAQERRLLPQSDGRRPSPSRRCVTATMPSCSTRPATPARRPGRRRSWLLPMPGFCTTFTCMSASASPPARRWPRSTRERFALDAAQARAEAQAAAAGYGGGSVPEAAVDGGPRARARRGRAEPRPIARPCVRAQRLYDAGVDALKDVEAARAHSGRRRGCDDDGRKPTLAARVRSHPSFRRKCAPRRRARLRRTSSEPRDADRADRRLSSLRFITTPARPSIARNRSSPSGPRKAK